MTAYCRQIAANETAVDDEMFLVPQGSEEILHLNPLGAALWRLLAEPTDEREIVEILAAAFPEIPRAALARDVAGFLERLAAHRLIGKAEA